MRKRIFRAMALLTSAALLLVSSAVSAVFYARLAEIARFELRERAGLFRNTDTQTAMREISDWNPADMRVTLILPDGMVAYDNTVDAGTLDNHAGREEVDEALTSGVGESRRFSDTLRQETYYYAVRLTDGSVLRVSKTISSVLGMFNDALPAVICVILITAFIGYALARNLTKRIVTPINNVNISDKLEAPYDELIPFVRTIERQREDIARQLSDLQDHADTISAIMDNMNEGIVLVDRHGTVASINKSAAALLGVEHAVSGGNILEIIRNVEAMEKLRAALSGSRSGLTEEYRGKTYRVFFSPVADGGAIILFLDITEKAMGEKLRREFSANVSHELKTPLTTIYGHAEMLAGGMIRENDKQKFYGKIKDEAQRLISLIEDIILISRLDEGKGCENFEEVELTAVAAETVEALSLKAQDHKVSVCVSGKDVFMRSDRSMLYELFYNLIDNAIKYNKPDGAVNVDITRMKNQISITVSDTGVGIPKESQARVFERFYRADHSRCRKSGGTGLGLAIVKHIVMLHDGAISLKSRENEGTAVTVTFPASS